MLSESILISVKPRFTAAISPRRKARASATRGELTRLWVVDPSLILLPVESDMNHASHAVFVALFQAASDLQVG